MNRVLLKENAKSSLKGKYKDAILIMVVYYLISFAVGFVLGIISGFLGLSDNAVDIITNIASIILSGVFGFGIISYYLKLSRNEEVTYKELFSKIDLCIPYIIISLLTGIFILLWSLLFIIPGIIASISYALVYYIKLDNPEMSAMEVINKSKTMMKGHKMDYFVLGLSFFGWILLGIFTFGILYLWLVPYMNVTMANFYNSLKESEATN